MHDARDHRVPPPLPPKDRSRLLSLIARVGEREACRLLDISRNLLARAAAGLPVRVASALVIAARLDALDHKAGVR